MDELVKIDLKSPHPSPLPEGERELMGIFTYSFIYILGQAPRRLSLLVSQHRMTKPAGCGS
jgi:hypothetical protein